MGRIYRIENIKQTGMYTCGAVKKIGAALYNMDGVCDEQGKYVPPRHPIPQDDTMLMNALREGGGLCKWSGAIYGRYVFGFSSVAQLRNWIYKDSWIQALSDEGMFLSVYDGETYFGNTQAVINYKTAKLVTRVPLDTLLVGFDENNIQ